MTDWLKRIWHDPVWSKVIAVGVLAALGFGWGYRAALVRAAANAWAWCTADILVSRGQIIGWFVVGVVLLPGAVLFFVRSTFRLVGSAATLQHNIDALAELRRDTAVPAIVKPAAAPPGEPERRRLNAVEIKVLRYLAEHDGKTVDVHALASYLGIKKLRAEHLLSKLEEDTDLIEVASGSFWLSEDGRDYVVKKGWA
jgi:hypothetical protein